MKSVKQLIPNALTISRFPLFLIVGAGMLILPNKALHYPTFWHGALFVAIGLVGLTDLLDGALARRWGCTSQLGSKLDKISDKVSMYLFIPLALVGMIHWFAVSVMLIRDIVVWFARRQVSLKTGEFMEADMVGKLKTCIAYFALWVLTAVLPVNESALSAGCAWAQVPLFWLTSTLLAVLFGISGVSYIMRARKMITTGNLQTQTAEA